MYLDTEYPSMGKSPTVDPEERKAWILARAREMDVAWSENPESAPGPMRPFFRHLRDRNSAFKAEAEELGLVPAFESIGYMESSRTLINSPLDSRIAPLLVAALPRAWYTRFEILDALRRMKFAPATPALVADYWRSLEMPEEEARRDWSAAALVACMTAKQRPLLIGLAEHLNPASDLRPEIIQALGQARRNTDRRRVIDLFRQWLLTCPFFNLWSIARAARSLKAYELLPDLREAAARLEAMPLPPRTRLPKKGPPGYIREWSHAASMRDSLVDAKRRYPAMLARMEEDWRNRGAPQPTPRADDTQALAGPPTSSRATAASWARRRTTSPGSST
jgi:hypothetical protein